MIPDPARAQTVEQLFTSLDDLAIEMDQRQNSGEFPLLCIKQRQLRAALITALRVSREDEKKVDETGGFSPDNGSKRQSDNKLTLSTDWLPSRLRAHRAMRLYEPSMEGYHAAVAVYEAAFGESSQEDALAAAPPPEPSGSVEDAKAELRGLIMQYANLFDVADAVPEMFDTVELHMDAAVDALISAVRADERQTPPEPSGSVEPTRAEIECALDEFPNGGAHPYVRAEQLLWRFLHFSAVRAQQAEQLVRRACACAVPDPVMQADAKFYCHQCSFETGARPTQLEPEAWLRRAEAAEARLAHQETGPPVFDPTSLTPAERSALNETTTVEPRTYPPSPSEEP
jgi:hypothetical protein